MAPRLSPNATDHDILIEIRTRLDVLQSSVRENNAAVAMRLDQLQNDKASSKDLDPLRTSIERQQKDIESKADKAAFQTLVEVTDGTRRLVYIGLGILIALQFFAPFLWAKLLH
jgi:hypothetical protein